MMTSKRWMTIRKSTGKAVRGFATRAAARNYKAANGFRLRILDTVSGNFVR